MSFELARAMLQASAFEACWGMMMEDMGSFLWDEHGEQVEDWNRLFGHPSGLPELSETIDDDERVTYHFAGRSVVVPFLNERGDNLIGIHTIGDLVYPDSELRFCRDSWHSSDVAFLGLSPAQWKELEQEFGIAKVALRFARPDSDFDTFVETGFGDPEDEHAG
jgi:hypothetical protein